MERNLEWLFDKFIAHKGFHTDIIPQNSLAAFKNAINNNYAIELDVRLLADNNIAVFHDSNLGKMTGQDGYISNLKTEDLQNYKLLKSNETIPTLKQVLELVNGRTPIFIDIKNESVQTGTFETQILENLKDYKGRIWIIGAWKDGFAEEAMRNLGGDIDVLKSEYFGTKYREYQYVITLIERK